jgi:rifampicin phosphotransferase
VGAALFDYGSGIHRAESIRRSASAAVEANFSGDTLTPQRLLHTTDTSFLNADRALWQLSRKARTLPTVRAAVEHLAAHEVMTALESYVEGQIFLAELRAWLSRYGMRSHGADGLSDGSWIDDPLPAIQHLQALLRKPDRDLEAEVRLQTVKCAAVVGQVRQRLTAHPSRVRYEQALAAAQMANFLSMEHNFWIDQQAMWCLRRVYLELGRRGVETGKIDQRDDVFFLIADEAQTLLRGSAAYGLRELVAMRRAQIMQARALSPPSFLGSIPLMAPPTEDPFVRAIVRVLGADALLPAGRPMPRAARQVSGQAASPGLARGRVRVLRGLNESDRLRPGDILVAEATMPAWTPLFAIAAAVVVDVGGILSHAATTAREYGIPAIVGTGNATLVLQDDQMVEVDGGIGAVRLIEGTD